LSIAIVLEILGYVSVSIILSSLDLSFGLEINIYIMRLGADSTVKSRVNNCRYRFCYNALAYILS